MEAKGLRLAELLTALSVVTDLGIGLKLYTARRCSTTWAVSASPTGYGRRRAHSAPSTGRPYGCIPTTRSASFPALQHYRLWP
jgi:hypothetical protein